MFKRYKSKVLLGYMQTIIKKPEILKLEVDEKDEFENPVVPEENLLSSVAKIDNRIEMLGKFVKQYYLNQLRAMLKKKGNTPFEDLSKEEQQRMINYILRVKDDSASGLSKDEEEASFSLGQQAVEFHRLKSAKSQENKLLETISALKL